MTHVPQAASAPPTVAEAVRLPPRSGSKAKAQTLPQAPNLPHPPRTQVPAMKLLPLVSLCLLSLLASSLLAADAPQTPPAANTPVEPTDKASRLDARSLRQKQDAQQKARTLTRELVAGILEVQLQQLEENGLSELPLYKEIEGMKANLATLVETEMGAVVDLLATAQTQPLAERTESYRLARQSIRGIVMKLSAQRQTLLRRLKAAELVAQVRRVLTQQVGVKKQVGELAELPAAQQEKLALVAIEDQADVRQLFLQLVETLSDVSRWDGPVGTGAADGLRALSAAHTGSAVDAASTELEATRFAAAQQQQAEVVQGLKLLLEALERAQGLLSSETQQGLELVRALLQQQQKLRDETRAADLAQPDKLIDRQAEIRKELGRLAQSLDQQLAVTPALQPLLEQAQAAAYDATGKLFDQDKDAALDRQGDVLGALAELEQRLQQAAASDQSDRSAAEMRQMVSQLAALKADLAKVEPDQTKAAELVTEKPAEALPAEKAAAEALAKLPDLKSLPHSVATRVEQAKEAARSAAEALAAATQAAAKQAVQEASRALEQARAEVAAALDDAKRQTAAIEIGELARAAEALERAAAAQREIGRSSREAAQAASDPQTPSPAPAQLEALRAEQAEIEAVAAKVAEGTQDTAASAQPDLQAAVAAAQAASKDLTEAREQAAAARATPTPDTRAALAKSAESAASDSDQAAEKLTAAAKSLREEIGNTADRLIAESDRQLDKVNQAEAKVEATLADAQASAQAKLTELASARDQVAAAQAKQEQASGRPQAASALNLDREIAQAQAKQSAADAAREDLQTGTSASPLEAATAQQAVAEASEAAAQKAKQSPASPNREALAAALNLAQSKSAEAAKALVDGRPSQAAALSQEARQALQAARELAQDTATAESKAPAGPADLQAQADVTKLAAEAEARTTTALPQAAQSLDEAQAESAKAIAAADRQETDARRDAQTETARRLADAAQSLNKAMADLGAETTQDLAKTADKADPLARDLADVDPAATAAARMAQQAAQKASGPQSDPSQTSPPQDSSPTQPSPAAAARAEQAVEQQLERAAANLAAREQRIAQDKAVAQALKELARDQQKAAEDIAAQRERLEALAQADEAPTKPMTDGPTTDSPQADPSDKGAEPDAANPADMPAASGKPKVPTGEQVTAARKLASATSRFAQAQRATGQGAEQVSGQTEVASAPIREALDRASGLTPESLPDFSSPESMAGEGTSATDAATGKQGDSPSKEPASNPDAANPDAASKPGNGSKESGSQPGQQPGQQPGESPSGDASPQSLGKDFVPNSPGQTARLMAGKKARAAAEAALGLPMAGDSELGRPETGSDAQQASADQQPDAGNEGKNPDGSQQPGESPEGQPGSPQPGRKDQPGAEDNRDEPSQQATNPNRPSSSSTPRNEGVKDGPLTKSPETNQKPLSAPGGSSQSNPEQRVVREESWVAKLPPELRQAMRARAQQRAPKGYEERLDRYFKSLD
jgi:hypothetical protein